MADKENTNKTTKKTAAKTTKKAAAKTTKEAVTPPAQTPVAPAVEPIQEKNKKPLDIPEPGGPQRTSTEIGHQKLCIYVLMGLVLIYLSIYLSIY